MAHVQEISFVATLGGTGQKVAFSTSSAASTALGTGQSGSMNVLVCVDTDCFMRQGASPTAVADTDLRIPAGQSFRVNVQCGNKLAFVGASAGNAYITPEN